MSNQDPSCSTMRPMERAIRMLAGTIVTVSLALGYFVSPYWFLLTLFVGLNLFQSSFTNWCLAEQIFTKLGIAVDDNSQSGAKANN
ncbi:YgaP family membrane protein [Fodinibius sp. AD559]|uniref:YgaP family membrane protein n=1 Tax=Fodinibius sp. AD559 TaxID=3424179 RepID=UPI0040470179